MANPKLVQFREELLKLWQADRDQREVNGPNRSPMIDAINKRLGVALGSPYCIGGLLVRGVEVLCKKYGLKNPVDMDASTQDFWQAMVKYHKLVGERGDIAIMRQYADAGRGHAWGVDHRIDDKHYQSIEYNTGDDGGRDGDGVYSHNRSTDGDGSKKHLGFVDVVQCIADANPNAFTIDPTPPPFGEKKDDALKPVAAPSTLPTLAWAKSHPDLGWTADAISLVSISELPDMNPPGIEKFWAGYPSANRESRMIFWVQLISIVVKYECAFDPKAVAKADVNGIDSIGLLQLSTTDVEAYHLPISPPPTAEEYTDPLINLRVGVLIMESIFKNPKLNSAFVGQDQDPLRPGHWLGLTNYWATLRDTENHQESYLGVLAYLRKAMQTV